jgi:hypothetical protein
MKKYVNAEENKIEYFMIDFFKVGTKVIVTDSSYMTDENGDDVNGLHFINGVNHELLEVVRINIPFKTLYGGIESLGHHNNCEIKGADGKRYHCSKINIKAFKS